MTERAEVLGALRNRIETEFPDAMAISTNESHNPATPMCVTVMWQTRRGRQTKVVRAPSIQTSGEAFSDYCMRTLHVFHQEHIQGSAF